MPNTKHAYNTKSQNMNTPTTPSPRTYLKVFGLLCLAMIYYMAVPLSAARHLLPEVSHEISAGIVSEEQPDTPKMFMVIKNDGSRYVGRIITRDARELLIDTQNLGEIIIPMHEVREIRAVSEKEVTDTGDYKPAEVFATRYFITTNGLPIEKGESYIIWNLYGPDMQFGVGKNFGLGIMTSWVGTPMIGTLKYSIDLPGDFSMAAGLLAGTGSWAQPDFGLLLPYVALTAGNRINNFTFSFGYGGAFYKENRYNPVTGISKTDRVSDGRPLLSVAGMFKIGKKLSFTFDTFIVPRGNYVYVTEYGDSYNSFTGMYEYYERIVRKRRPGLALIIPGIRLQTDPNRAFQFGFAGVRYDGELAPVPFPMIQWYRKL